MPKFSIQSRETWTVLADYSIEAESQEEAEEEVKDGQPQHQEFERINREVEKIVDVHHEMEM